MVKITFSETELEKNSGAFLAAVASLPMRRVYPNNGKVSAGGITVSLESTFFQKLIDTGLLKSVASGYEVTDYGIKLAGK